MDQPKKTRTNEQILETENATSELSSDTADDSAAGAIPERLGRYQVRGVLGRGGFAKVLLAHDGELDRLVALKIPLRERFRTSDSLAVFLAEAKMAARLRHPGIVTVFDVGVEGTTPYIVLEYVRGRTLSQFLRQDSLSHTNAARLIRDVADAMTHAHAEGFVHRDLKPSNILVDNDDRPHISDFGLALRHRDVEDLSTRLVGTPHYMAPEQATGENHRIDERTDIFALGVIFYQILCGRTPFHGDDLGELLRQITLCDFSAPTNVDAKIPRELERICMRCLARRMSERYRYASELASELSDWLRFAEGGSGSDSDARSSWSRSAFVGPGDAPVIPRGLRAFGPQDADFFMRLLPGPRDRDGLPTTLGFWKHAIEQEDPEQTFRVGLLYGPSGCGKSSLVQAGLLPRLSSAITPIYVDATATHLEDRLQRALRRKFKRLPRNVDLSTTLFELREGDRALENGKVLLVIDQFEQWLSSGQLSPDSTLVQALRQCDGGKLQCLLLVRDDFWLPISRFMHLLEVGIVDGGNARLIDSFDADHARRVLREFGVAYECLPREEHDISASQNEFLDRCIAELTEDGRLYPVRLTVFAEMVRDQPWHPDTLDRMGGTDGIGVAFLEQAVGRNASSARRIHTEAARKVLAALLPASGLIKESAVPRRELMEVSGYADRPRDFDQLMHLLDNELRLLTPLLTEEGDSDSVGSDPSTPLNLEPHYQLTHDFLVPSIREWLERELRSTTEGRLQLMLSEQANLWSSRPSSRLLPSVVEWLQYHLRTRQQEWTPTQREMMRSAGRRIRHRAAIGCAIAAALVTVGLLVFQRVERRRHAAEAEFLFSALQEVDMNDVPTLLDEMQPYHAVTAPLVEDLLDDDEQPRAKRVRAAMARLRHDSGPVEQMVNWMVDPQMSAQDFLVALEALKPHADVAETPLLAVLQSERLSEEARLRAASGLAVLQPGSPALESLHEELAATLLQQPAADARIWTTALRPISEQLLPPLRELTANTTDFSSARVGVAAISEYSERDFSFLLPLLRTADEARFQAVVEQLRMHPTQAADMVRQELSVVETNMLKGQSTATELLARSNLTLAAIALDDIQPMLRMTSRQGDPLNRTHIIAATTPGRLEFSRLQSLVAENVGDPDLCGALLLAASNYVHIPISNRQYVRWVALLKEIYLSAADGEMHSAAGIALRRQGVDTQEIDRTLAADSVDTEKMWHVDPLGQTMIVLSASSRTGVSQPMPPRPFAISATEVPLELFQKYRPEAEVSIGYRVSAADTPATEIIKMHIAGFCNWLSEKAGVEPEQWCYPPVDQLTPADCLPYPDFAQRTGYRLPTTDEWQAASLAVPERGWLKEAEPEIADDYVWSRLNGGMQLQPVATRLPNPLGIFDLYGNASESCLVSQAVADGLAKQAFESRGGSVLADSKSVRSPRLNTRENPQTVSPYAGFRVVRTIPE